MARNPLSSQFAPADRADTRALTQQSDILSNQAHLVDILDAVSTQVVILNKQRQIVFGNKTFLDFLQKTDLSDITGKRLGEVIGCIHANKTEGGCGTTVFCTMCGAVNAMLSAQKGETDVQECRITLEEESKALDLRVMASPFTVKGDEFTVFSIQDIGDEKRKDFLERIFKHDLLNTAGGLRSFSRLMTSASEKDLFRYTSIVNELAERLVDEIESHKQLMQAENQELEIEAIQIRTLNLISKVRDTYLMHDVALGKKIEIEAASEDHLMESDEGMLLRILGNMTKNALEAISPGETVSLSCLKNEGMIRFSVKNPGTMPQPVRLQIFQRSFSTKGSGRGLGTYSIKLLSEQYLKGKVGFTSSNKEGTEFFGEYPCSL